MTPLEEHRKMQRKLGTGLSVWPLPLNPKVFGEEDSEKSIPFGICSSTWSKKQSQGHAGTLAQSGASALF